MYRLRKKARYSESVSVFPLLFLSKAVKALHHLRGGWDTYSPPKSTTQSKISPNYMSTLIHTSFLTPSYFVFFLHYHFQSYFQLVHKYLKKEPISISPGLTHSNYSGEVW